MDRRSRRRRLLFAVLLLGGAGWYARSRLTAVREPWSSVPLPGEPVAPGEPAPPSFAPPSVSWAEPAAEVAVPLLTRPSPSPRPAPASAGRPAGTDGSSPGPDYTIKGNADSMLFHTSGSPYYKRTRAEVWFRDADEARAAGFTEWTPKRRAAR